MSKQVRGRIRGVLAVLVLGFVGADGAAGEVKVVEGVHFAPPRPEIPDRLMQPARAWLEQADEETVTEPLPVEDFVPLALYGGGWGDATWASTFERVKKYGGNCYYLNGSQTLRPPSTLRSNTEEGLELMCRLAEAAGVRLYYQNQESPLHWPIRETMGPPREQVYEHVSEWVARVLPRFASDPQLRAGLLAWGVTEEIDEPTARDPLLHRLREEMQELDPYHPPLILVMPHTPKVQQALYETWGHIPVTLTDHYLNHRGLPWNPVGFNIQRLQMWSKMAREHDSEFWLMSACFAMMSDLDPEVEEGYRGQAPEEVSRALWTGLAAGATGFILFIESDNGDGWGRACFTRFDWQPTEEFMAASRFFVRARRLAPLIGGWTWTGEMQVVDGVAVGAFEHPEYEGQFVVLANIDPFTPAVFTPQSHLYELEGFTPVRRPIELLGGEGAVLFRGTRTVLGKLEEKLGPGVWPLRETAVAPESIQRWETGASDESPVNIQTQGALAFGGKGALPVIHRPDVPDWGGELVPWSEDVNVPSRVYYPPYPGTGGEAALHLQWDLSGLADAEVDRAVLRLKLAEPVGGGRLAVYPVVEDGIGFNGQTEYMPRWEHRFGFRSAEEDVNAQVTGIVRQWVEGELPNRGLILVYEGFPTDRRSVALEARPRLEIRHTAAPASGG